MTVVLRPPVVGLLEELGRPLSCADVADEVHEALTVAGGGGLADVDVDLGGGTIDVDSRARTSSRRAAVVVTSLRNAARSGLLTVLTCAASPLRAAFGSVGVTAWANTRVEQVTARQSTC